MVDAIARFRKKWTLALLLFVAGTTLAFIVEASLTEYSFFAGTLLAIFGAADVAEKQVMK